ncbi:MAG: hypothetical protein [Caudoviricetes sp.]|nr:MAG: hypothetical protein [Caudoviricetes sp.]
MIKKKTNRKPKFKNVYIDHSSNFEKYKIDEFYNIECIINPSDIVRTEYYIKQEGAYYNSLVVGFSPFIRTSDKLLRQIKDNYLQLYLDLASTGFKISPCMYKQIELPEKIKKYNNIIYGTDNKKREITPQLAYILDIVAAPANIISYMRENIAKEILFNIIDQLNKISINYSTVDDGEIVYQKPLEILEPVDPYYRNTLQLTRSCLTISYNEKYNCSVIKSQYFINPVIVENINLVENKNWNILLIKYNYVDKNKIWSITTKKTKNTDYILRVSTIKKAR